MSRERAAQHAEEVERSNLGHDPLVMALGWHMVGCLVCCAAGRAVCPVGRSLGDVAYAAMQARRAA